MNFMKMLKEFDPVLLCPDCECIRTDRSRHCSICNMCVERFDHHCPWINNCVGIHNHGFFMCFLLSMLSLLILTFVSMVLNYNALSNPSANRPGNNIFYNKWILPEEAYASVSKDWADHNVGLLIADSMDKSNNNRCVFTRSHAADCCST